MNQNESKMIEEISEDLDMAAAEAIEMPVVKKDKKVQVSDLVEMGRAKGKLTTQEIMDALEDLDFDPEQMDKLYESLESQNIKIIDDFEADAFADLEFVLEAAESEEAEPAPGASSKLRRTTRRSRRSAPTVSPSTTRSRSISKRSAGYPCSLRKRRSSWPCGS